MYRFLILPLLALLLAACGSNSSQPGTSTPSSSANKFATYTDKNFKFSFSYPASWSIPAKGGSESRVGGVRTYILPISIPGNLARAEVTIDGNVTPLPQVTDGEVRPDPNGGPIKYHYYHAQLSGWMGLRAERWTPSQMDEVDTVANTKTKSYDVRLVAATPPFKQDVLSGYLHIVHSMSFPSS